MQCNSCHFENMPGVASCGRCGATIIAASKAIDVHPPRARPGIKRLRSKFYFLYRIGRPLPWVDDRIHNIREQIDALYQDRLPWGVFCRMPVPGWPQFYLGRVVLGRIFLAGYLLSLLLGVLWAGTTFGGMMLGCAIACHASSILNITIARNSDLSARLFYSMACFFLLLTLIYGPATWLINRMVVPQQFIADIPPINAGDVILYNPTAYRSTRPQVGDLVIYMLPDRYVINPGHRQYNLGGQAIAGRVLAGPGQKVTAQKGLFYVDGVLSPWQLSLPMAEFAPRTMPENGYYIMSDIGLMPGLPPVPTEMRHRIVGLSEIRGRVYWRTQPITRFGPIR